MAAVFDSAIDKAFSVALEAADADAAVALLAAVASLDDFARSARSLLTCPSRSAIRASMGLRSVQPAVITSKAKMEAFGIVILHSFVSKADRSLLVQSQLQSFPIDESATGGVGFLFGDHLLRRAASILAAVYCKENYATAVHRQRRTGEKHAFLFSYFLRHHRGRQPAPCDIHHGLCGCADCGVDAARGRGT